MKDFKEFFTVLILGSSARYIVFICGHFVVNFLCSLQLLLLGNLHSSFQYYLC